MYSSPWKPACSEALPPHDGSLSLPDETNIPGWVHLAGEIADNPL